MFQVQPKNLSGFNISGKLSANPAQRVKTITRVVAPGIAVILFFTLFSFFTRFYSLAWFNLVVFSIILAGLVFVYRHVFAAGKTMIIIALTLCCFVYYKQFDTDYYIFCYFFPLVFGIFMFFDFVTEFRSFLVIAGSSLVFCIASFFLPSHLFGNMVIPPQVKPISQFLNIFFSVSMCILYMLILIRVTVAKQMDLLQAKNTAEKASNAKAAFLSNMSHELRTPLNGIIGTAHILQTEKDPAEVRKHTDALRYLAEHMTGLVNDILDYSKIESGKLELHNTRFNVTELYHKIAVIFKNTTNDKALAFNLDVDSRLSKFDVLGDEMKVMQVMNNFLSNAIKFTDKGFINAYASIVTSKEDAVTILMGVKDTGIGISKEHIEKIFEGFQQADGETTRKYGGTGLGLTISKSIIELMNGTMNVDSEPGLGSNFYFTINLPLLQKENVISAAADPHHAPLARKMKDFKILLAEDNPINMVVARKIMQKWGVQITEALNGADAVQKFRAGNFDLVLLDLEMPEMDGRQAAKIITSENSDIQVIAFTAAFYENIREDLAQFGFHDYMPKPFKPEDLYQKIITQLHIKEN
jgi:signal transduction histidine kinase/CheY-like chemotaxis protein